MRILRRAGYPRRTPHMKSACATTQTGAHSPACRVPTSCRSTPTSDGSTAPLTPTAHRSAPAGPPLAPGTVLIRQSKDVTFEAPFILLLLGERRALLLDTGAVDGTTLRETVDRLVADWRSTRTKPDAYDLVSRNTHGHGDHVAGDAAFADRPHTTVVGHDVDAVRAHFRITDWPHRGRHARSRGPDARDLRHPRPPRGLDRGPRPDDRAAAHGRHGLPRSHLRRRPHRSSGHARPACLLRGAARRPARGSAATSR